MSKSIAIDLGTTNSVITHRTDGGTIEVIPNLDGQLKTRSITTWASGKPLAGQAAEPDLVLAPNYVARVFKRYMGEVGSDNQPLALLSDPAGKPLTAVDNSAALLSYLKQSAEAYLGCSIDSAVISFPAYFKEPSRDATHSAARIAGFECVRMVEEPVAAALHYGLEKGRDENLVVIDFGGGTLDVTFMQVKSGSAKARFTTGDSELGGENYTEAILQHACQKAGKEGLVIDSGTDLACFYQNVDKACQAKEMLARRESVVLMPEAGGRRTTVELTRKLLRKIAKEYDQRFMDCCRQLADQVAQANERIDRVLLVGGSSRLPHVKEMVQDVFQITPSTDTDPDLVVAKGAAVWSAVCFGSPDEALVIGEHRYLPSEITITSVSAHAICVAARKADDPSGVEYNHAIVPANTALPCTFKKKYAPLHPSQHMVVVKLVQGQPDQPSESSTLIREIRAPIQPSEKDASRICVQGEYTEEGLLKITVIDELLGQPVSESIVYKTGLSEADIQIKKQELEA